MKSLLLPLLIICIHCNAQDTAHKEFFMEIPYSSGGCIQFSHVEKMQAAGVKSYPNITVVARDNNKLIIDSIGGKWPLSMELFHRVSKDSVIGFYYNFMGLKYPNVSIGDTAIICAGNRKSSYRLYIKIIKK